jgi:hypothetical protein
MTTNVGSAKIFLSSAPSASGMDALAAATTWSEAMQITKKVLVEADKCMYSPGTHLAAWSGHPTSCLNNFADAEQVGPDGSSRAALCAFLVQGYDKMASKAEAEAEEAAIIAAATVKRLKFQRDVLARLQSYTDLPFDAAELDPA